MFRCSLGESGLHCACDMWLALSTNVPFQQVGPSSVKSPSKVRLSTLSVRWIRLNSIDRNDKTPEQERQRGGKAFLFLARLKRNPGASQGAPGLQQSMQPELLPRTPTASHALGHPSPGRVPPVFRDSQQPVMAGSPTYTQTLPYPALIWEPQDIRCGCQAETRDPGTAHGILKFDWKLQGLAEPAGW